MINQHIVQDAYCLTYNSNQYPLILDNILITPNIISDLNTDFFNVITFSTGTEINKYTIVTLSLNIGNTNTQYYELFKMQLATMSKGLYTAYVHYVGDLAYLEISTPLQFDPNDSNKRLEYWIQKLPTIISQVEITTRNFIDNLQLSYHYIALYFDNLKIKLNQYINIIELNKTDIDSSMCKKIMLSDISETILSKIILQILNHTNTASLISNTDIPNSTIDNLNVNNNILAGVNNNSIFDTVQYNIKSLINLLPDINIQLLVFKITNELQQLTSIDTEVIKNYLDGLTKSIDKFPFSSQNDIVALIDKFSSDMKSSEFSLSSDFTNNEFGEPIISNTSLLSYFCHKLSRYILSNLLTEINLQQLLSGIGISDIDIILEQFSQTDINLLFNDVNQLQNYSDTECIEYISDQTIDDIKKSITEIDYNIIQMLDIINKIRSEPNNLIKNISTLTQIIPVMRKPIENIFATVNNIDKNVLTYINTKSGINKIDIDLINELELSISDKLTYISQNVGSNRQKLCLMK